MPIINQTVLYKNILEECTVTKAFVVSFTLIVLFFGYNNSYSEVIRLQNGEIYFGKVVSADSDGITVESFGKTIKLPQKDILRTDKDMSSIKNQQLEIILKDDSRLKGKIQNYDDDIGILLNIEFGSLTLPVQSVREISDAAQKKYYSGAPFHVGIAGGYYFLFGDVASRFGSSYSLNLFSEFNLNYVRGLFAGGEIGTTFVDYKSDSQTKYNLFSFQPYLMYRFLFLRTSDSFVRIFVPFVAAGAGTAYLVKETGVTQKSEIDLIYNVKAGVDAQITSNLWLRFYTGWESVPQKKDSFNKIVLNAGLVLAF